MPTSHDNKIELWHCADSRSLRPLWTLEELGLDYRLHLLPFPPRVHAKEYLRINSLGTVPFMRLGDTEMTESVAMCQFLAELHPEANLHVSRDEPAYADYLNWLHHADATLTFPQTLVLRYGALEAAERRQPQVVDDYRRWFLGRLRRLEKTVDQSEYVCANRFTVADICIAYAIYLGDLLGLSDGYADSIHAYLDRLTQQDAFVRASSKTAEDTTIADLHIDYGKP